MDPFDPQDPNALLDPFEIAMTGTPDLVEEFPVTDDYVQGVEDGLAAEQAQDTSEAWPPSHWQAAQDAKESFESYLAENPNPAPPAAPDPGPLAVPQAFAPVVDAVQDTVGQVREQQAQPHPLEVPKAFAPAVDAAKQAAGQVRDQYDNSIPRRVERLEQMDPEQREAQFAQQDFEDEQWYRGEINKLRQQNSKELLGIEKRAQTARVEAQQESARILDEIKTTAAQDLDAGRWGKSNGTLVNIGLAIGAAMGGFLESRNGTKNQALEFIKAQVEGDLQRQKADRAHRMDGLSRQANLLDRMRQTVEDERVAEHAFRMARWEQAIAEIDAQAAQLHPEGTQARKLFEMRQQARAEQAKAQFEMDGTLLERRLDIVEQERKNLETNAKVALDGIKLQQEQRKLARIGRGGGARKHPPEYWATMYPGLKPPPVAMSDKEFRAYLSNAKSVKSLLDEDADPKAAADLKKAHAEARMKHIEANSGPGGNPYAIGDLNGNPLKNKDGTVFAVPDTTLRGQLSGMYAAAANIRRIADLAAALREKDGGASEILGSKEYQELTSLAASIDFETYKAFDLGAPSAGDAQMAEDARGGKDITSWIYDASKGWDAYADNVERKLDAHFRIQGGYTGDRIRIPKKPIKKNEERSASAMRESLLSPQLTIQSESEFIVDKRKEMQKWLNGNPSRKEMRRMAKDIYAQAQKYRTGMPGNYMSVDDAREVIGLMRKRWHESHDKMVAFTGDDAYYVQGDHSDFVNALINDEEPEEFLESDNPWGK